MLPYPVRGRPSVVLAPMEGVTDAPMRATFGELGAFDYAVTEFFRISQTVPPARIFARQMPELLNANRTPSGLFVQLQLLGGDPGRMAEAAGRACEAGAAGVDLNFGCPAPTVNKHDGGATLLKHPDRLRAIVVAVRAAVPKHWPVSAKLRLGWDTIDAIEENAMMAAEGGASWLTIHARTRMQGYQPPVNWDAIGKVRARLNLPIVANGDIWNEADFVRCRDATGCEHYMLGRGALANPMLSWQVARRLGLGVEVPKVPPSWVEYLTRFLKWTKLFYDRNSEQTVFRMKQWLKLAARHGEFGAFEQIKQCQSAAAILAALGTPELLLLDR